VRCVQGRFQGKSHNGGCRPQTPACHSSPQQAVGLPGFFPWTLCADWLRIRLPGGPVIKDHGSQNLPCRYASSAPVSNPHLLANHRSRVTDAVPINDKMSSTLSLEMVTGWIKHAVLSNGSQGNIISTSFQPFDRF